MTSMLTARLAMAALALSTAGVPAAWAGSPLALWLEVSGSVDPAVDPYTEATSDAAVRLADGASLRFFHYGKSGCADVVVKGPGLLQVGADAYQFAGRSRPAATTRDCPGVLHISGTSGGILFRNASNLPVVALAPDFHLLGPATAGIGVVRVAPEGAPPLADLPVSQGVAAWRGSTPLQPGRRYLVTLIGADGTAKSSQVFLAEAARASRVELFVLR